MPGVGFASGCRTEPHSATEGMSLFAWAVESPGVAPLPTAQGRGHTCEGHREHVWHKAWAQPSKRTTNEPNICLFRPCGTRRMEHCISCTWSGPSAFCGTDAHLSGTKLHI